MKANFTYIVLGLGGLGSAAAYWLARRFGGDVPGIEQFEIGHVRGGSQESAGKDVLTNLFYGARDSLVECPFNF